jgi:hypothetical protein
MKRSRIILFALVVLLVVLSLPAVARADDPVPSSESTPDGWTWDAAPSPAPAPDGWTWDETPASP